ncbi:tissue factor-like isoform X2 [Sphaeramia orbicularis]|uniref:Tissue factor n=1 Tax=Sphaeramia orbicularis TaxID=375764 RepID=A0A673A1W8_9TELE|nr:tissue factor-like isoform X2 [Sphaeramia orbicularis]
MASLKTALYVGACMTAWMITTAKMDIIPKAENVHWQSVDFKTILIWTATPSDYTYTVLYSEDGGNWDTNPDCIQISDSECDMTNSLKPFDRTYTADIQTEPAGINYDSDHDEFPHTYSPPFNPYRQSEISAVNFTVESVEETAVSINIIDPLTSIHEHTKQLSIRDILKKDLKYKIMYYKSGSTGKRDVTSNSSTAKISNLDAGQSYCFMVAAFIPSRAKAHKQGEWSSQICTPGHKSPLGELSLGALVGGIFILIVVLIIIVTVAVLCCKCCRQKKTIQQSSHSTVV